jgi:hypothetical protein
MTHARPSALLALLLLGLPSCSSDGDGPRGHARLGAAAVDGTASACPSVTTFELLPSEVTLGSAMALRGAALDPGGGEVSYAWRASNPAGVVVDPTYPATSLRCDAPGTVVVTLTASNGKCADSMSGVVDCVAPASLFRAR